MSIQKSIALLSTSSEHLNNKTETIIPFTITQKMLLRCKSNIQDLYAENYKTLWWNRELLFNLRTEFQFRTMKCSGEDCTTI